MNEKKNEKKSHLNLLFESHFEKNLLREISLDFLIECLQFVDGYISDWREISLFINNMSIFVIPLNGFE